MTDCVAAFFAAYPPSVNELAGRLREHMRAAISDAAETLDESGRVVGYGLGGGYTGLICTIIPSKSGVKLGIVGGAALADPHGILEGAGKRRRFVQASRLSDLEQPGIDALLEAARRVVKP